MELWFSERHTKGVKFSIKVDRQLFSGHSEFQRVLPEESTGIPGGFPEAIWTFFSIRWLYDVNRKR